MRTILVRAVVCDDEKPARAAVTLLKEAEIIAVSVPCLCEFIWILCRVYRLKTLNIVAVLNALLAAGNVVAGRPGVDAGLAVFKTGGDFADGLIAYEEELAWRRHICLL